MFCVVSFTLRRSCFPARNATHLRTFCFFRSCLIFAFGEFFCQPACPFAARFTLKTALNYHIRNATNLRTFCFKDHPYESFFLSRDSLSCATHLLDLCTLFKFTFLYLRTHSAPFLRFSQIFLTPIFSCVYCHAEYKYFSLMMPLISESSEFNFDF